MKQIPVLLGETVTALAASSSRISFKCWVAEKEIIN